MSETCCKRLAGNTARKKSPSAHRRTTLSGYIFVTKARIDNRKKELNSSISPTYPYNMVNFGPLTAEIFLASLGHPSIFQRVSRLCSVTVRHSTSGRQPNCGVEQRAPPTFYRAAIMLSIGQHSSLLSLAECMWTADWKRFCPVVSSSTSIFFPRLIPAVGYWMSVSAILLHTVWP